MANNKSNSPSSQQYNPELQNSQTISAALEESRCFNTTTVSMDEEDSGQSSSTNTISNLHELNRLDSSIIGSLDEVVNTAKWVGQGLGFRGIVEPLNKTERCMMKTVIRNCADNASRQVSNASNNNVTSCRPPKSLCPMLCVHPNPDTVNHMDLFNRCFGTSSVSRRMHTRRKKNSIYSESENEHVQNDIDGDDDDLIGLEKMRRQRKRISKADRQRRDSLSFDLSVDFEMLTNDMRIGYLFRFGCKKETQQECPKLENNICVDLDPSMNDSPVDSSTCNGFNNSCGGTSNSRNNSHCNKTENSYCRNESMNDNYNRSENTFRINSELNQASKEMEFSCSRRKDNHFKTDRMQKESSSINENCICYHCGATDDLTISKGKIMCQTKCSRSKSKSTMETQSDNYESSDCNNSERMMRKSQNNCNEQPLEINMVSPCECPDRCNRPPPFKVIPREKSIEPLANCFKSDKELNDQGILNKYGIAKKKIKCQMDPSNFNEGKSGVAKKRQLMNQCKMMCSNKCDNLKLTKGKSKCRRKKRCVQMDDTEENIDNSTKKRVKRKPSPAYIHDNISRISDDNDSDDCDNNNFGKYNNSSYYRKQGSSQDDKCTMM